VDFNGVATAHVYDGALGVFSIYFLNHTFHIRTILHHFCLCCNTF
jgi:hypothetical protein